MRHLDKFIDPNEPDLDPEDGKHHLAKVAWNALVLLYHIQTRPELDTRWKPKNSELNLSPEDIEDYKLSLTDTNVDPKFNKNMERKDDHSIHLEMAEKIYLANMSGHKVDMGENNEKN